MALHTEPMIAPGFLAPRAFLCIRCLPAIWPTTTFFSGGWFFKKHLVQKQIMIAIIVSGHGGGAERGKGRRARRRVFHVIERVSQREMSLRHSVVESITEDLLLKMSYWSTTEDLRGPGSRDQFQCQGHCIGQPARKGRCGASQVLQKACGAKANHGCNHCFWSTLPKKKWWSGPMATHCTRDNDRRI